jgi:hypothetical protein
MSCKQVGTYDIVPSKSSNGGFRVIGTTGWKQKILPLRFREEETKLKRTLSNATIGKNFCIRHRRRYHRRNS